MEKRLTIRDTGVKVTDILRLVSQGYNNQQIIAKYPRLVMGDILLVAQFALDLVEQYVTPEETIQLDHAISIKASGGKIVNLDALRKTFPRAYQPWKANEETQLIDLHRHGATVARIASILQRQPGAIRSRLERLGLTTEEKPPDRPANR